MKLNKAVPRVITENKGTYLGIFYMVLLSSFLFVFFMLAAANLSTNKDAYFTDLRAAKSDHRSSAGLVLCFAGTGTYCGCI